MLNTRDVAVILTNAQGPLKEPVSDRAVYRLLERGVLRAKRISGRLAYDTASVELERLKRARKRMRVA